MAVSSNVTHHATRVARMKDPAEGFSKVIAGVDDTRDVAHDNVASILPVLYCKMLDINVA